MELSSKEESCSALCCSRPDKPPMGFPNAHWQASRGFAVDGAHHFPKRQSRETTSTKHPPEKSGRDPSIEEDHRAFGISPQSFEHDRACASR